MGNNHSPPVKQEGENVNSVIINESLQVHNDNIELYLCVITVMLAINLVFQVAKYTYKNMKKNIRKEVLNV